MAQSNLSSHSLSPRINRRSPASASEDDFHLRTSSAVRTASPGINIAYSSEEELLHQRASSSTPEHQLGSDVPATDPERHTTVISEDPEHAVDAHITSLEPVSGVDDDLKFRPTILQPLSIAILVCLYTAVAVGIGIMLRSAGAAQQFQISSENVHMIARYFPSIVGTVTVLLFQHTVSEFLRMRPYIAMADQKGVAPGAVPWRSVSGGFFPWQDVFVTPGLTSWFSLLCQLAASFVVSLKVALLATTGHPDGTWTLTLRTYPALALICGYMLMATYTALIGFQLRGKSTGLKWDPVSIADFVSLFAQCNALKYFEPLELRHETKAKEAMSTEQYFRIGYWEKRTREKHTRDSPPEVVYGIGVAFGHSHQGPRTVDNNDNNNNRTGGKHNRREPKPLLPNTRTGCKCKEWPKCEHYPYRHNPGVARWFLIVCILIVWAAFALSIAALGEHWPMHGFSVPNNWSLPADWNVTTTVDNHTLSLFQPVDAKPTLLIYALLFRSLPTYAAGLFINSIIPALDLNMRFMQPFVSMFEEPGKASETVLLAYITLSPLQVPLTAYDHGHYKVSWFSTLNTLSPLFPIFVGGLLTVSTVEDQVKLNFSLTAYIGILVSLALYSVSLPVGFPRPHRLLPRQFYSLADLMAMCHESRFLSSPHLNIASRRITPTKAYMEARILLSRAEFLFGIYTGRDGRKHLGFDVAKTAVDDPNQAESTGCVQWIEPHGRSWTHSRRGRAYTIKMNTQARMEHGQGAYAPINTGYAPAEQARRVHYEAYEMSGVTSMDPGPSNATAYTGTSGVEQPMMSGEGGVRPVTATSSVDPPMMSGARL